jgi:hypothetical protein
MMPQRRSLLALGTVFFALLAGGAVQAQEAYYVLVFGSQRLPNNPDYSHSFATFVRAAWSRPAGTPPQLEVHTISWLPRDGPIRAFALLPECGQNLDLPTTLRYALAEGERISLWGPYQIRPELYQRALVQIQLLESGKVRYKANDIGYPTNRVSNCIHAVSSLVEGHRLHVVIPSWGETASYYIQQELRPWIIEPCRTHLWVAAALGLDSYPIIYRQPDEHPYSGLLRAPLHRLLSGEPAKMTR